MELYKLISKLNPDVVVLTDIRVEAGTTLRWIWPGCQIEEVLPF